jgi:hypothetical protein
MQPRILHGMRKAPPVQRGDTCRAVYYDDIESPEVPESGYTGSTLAEGGAGRRTDDHVKNIDKPSIYSAHLTALRRTDAKFSFHYAMRFKRPLDSPFLVRTGETLCMFFGDTYCCE